MSNVLTLAFIALLGAMSPGPDFAMVTKNSMTGSFRAGFMTALGISAALLVHASYCVFGIALLIVESPYLFNIIKYLGSAYLLYLGVMLLVSKPKPADISGKLQRNHTAFISGFLCNLLNPKATLFILSLFTQFIDPAMSTAKKMGMGSVIAIMALLWFTLLSFLITHHLFNKHFLRFQVVICKVMGVALCLLALYIAL